MLRWFVVFAADIDAAKALVRKHNLWGHWVWANDKFSIMGLRPDQATLKSAEGWQTNPEVTEAYGYFQSLNKEAA